MKKLFTTALGLSLLTPGLVLADVNRECRGVAAGVVSSMRANNEIQDEAMMKAAILAARRACVAALEGFSAEELSVSENEESSDDEDKKSMDEMSVWEFLSQEQERNPGHERLKKRRQ